VRNREAPYQLPRALPLNAYAYGGRWRVGRERIVAGHGARLRLHFLAKDVFLVLGGRGTLDVFVDGHRKRRLRVEGISRLYTLLRYPQLETHVLELRFSRGLAAYAFTFG
jgi:hypothetical protein